MRVVLIASIAPAVEALYGALRAFGHEPVALLATREHLDRYGAQFETLLREAPGDLDVVIPSRRDRIAPLLKALEPDVAFCAGFPWKIPADAIAVPRHGIINGHPSALPKYRGPSPLAWAVRAGETEIGFTFHYMDGELDTGNILGQTTVPLGDEQTWDELTPKLVEAVRGLFPPVLARIEAGDPGDPQPESVGGYQSFFEPEYAWIDWSRTRDEIARQVRAWRFHSQSGGEHGALMELDGETVRVLRISGEPGSGRELECGDGTLWVVETEPA